MSDDYVFCCNEAYLKDELFVDGKCQFCGEKIKITHANLFLPGVGVIEIKFDNYSKKYHLCKDCSNKVIKAIDREERVIKNI